MYTEKKVDKYELLNDAYYGTGLFEGGKGLRRHPRESLYNYNDRKQLAYYLNYTGPIVNASVDPIFRDEIKRNYSDSKMFSAFMDDVDGTGSDLQDYIRRMAIFAKLYGVVYIIVNNDSDFLPSVEENINSRKLPFLIHVLPKDVTGWKFDESGKLLSFTHKQIVMSENNREEELRYTWTPSTWSVEDSKGRILKEGNNPLGEIPIVQWFGRSMDVTNMLPPSEFLSVAQTNYHLYQLCSWHTQILRDQAFSILTMPDTGNGTDEITIGTNNVLTYDPQANHTPAFISPDAGPANMLTDQIDRLISEMYRMSGVDCVVGVQQAKSGVAKQWDFERTNQKLADFSVQCENAEYNIIKYYEMWTNETLGYSCEYPRDFKINDVADSLNEAQQAIDLGFQSDTYTIEVAKKVLQAYMPNLEEDVYEDILQELEQAKEEQLQQKAYGDVSVKDIDDEDSVDLEVH